MEKSRLVRFIGKFSTIVFIILVVTNLWLNGKNPIIELVMWMFGCVSILWIIWTANTKTFRKRIKK